MNTYTDLSLLKDYGEEAEEALGGSLEGWTESYGELTLMARRESLLKVIMYVRESPLFRCESLMDICGVDYPGRSERFEIVYHLLSMTKNLRVRVKIMVGEESPVPSLVSLFPAANWYEREVFDMYGVMFEDHPDLRRILTDYGFSGYPLRKDFPLTGYVQVRYDEEQKRVVQEPVDLVQAYRDFDFESPWENLHAVQAELSEKSGKVEKGA